MKKRYCIYRFLNKSNEIIYIGKTCSENPQLRFNGHFSKNGHLEKECYKSIDRIEITELNSEADVMIYEPYLINLYKPIYNTDFKTKDMLSIQLPELKWIDKDIYLNQIKEEKEKYTNTIEYQKSKDESRENKVKGYDEFFEWYNNWNGSLIKAKDIKSICNLDNEQFKTLCKNKTIKDAISKLDKPKRGYYSK